MVDELRRGGGPIRRGRLNQGLSQPTPFTRSSSASPFDTPHDPPFGGSCQARDCTTSMREKLTDACTDGIIDLAKNKSLALRKLTMRATIPLSHLQLPSRSRLAARLPDFVSLMKPRVMLLAVFTALVGLVIAPGHLDPLLGSIAILAIATGAGAAGVLNMWHDADIDAVMARTAGRPIPRGRISRAEALAFGLVLACGAVAVLALALNVKAAALLAFTIFFYVVVYTVWLKAIYATEHRHWRRRWCASAGDRLDRGNRKHWA